MLDPKADNSLALQLAAKKGHTDIVKLLLPSSDIDKAMLDFDFIETSGCDLVLSCLPLAKARELVAAHPDIAFPRTRAVLNATSLRKRPVVTSR